MNTSVRRLAAALLAGALILGACSDGGGGASEEEAAENPKQAFTEALDALADYEGVTLEMTLEADPAALEEEDTPPEAVEAILNSSLTISAKGETAEDSQVQFTINVDGNEDAFELRGVDQSVYLRADVNEVVEKFGGDTSQVDAFAQQAAAGGFDFAQPFVEGEWIGISGIDELAEQFGLPQPTPDAEEAQQVVDQIAAILEENVEVGSEGTDDVGAHLVLTIPLRDTLQELINTLQSIANAPAGTFPTDALTDVPDADIPIDAWVSDGRLVQIELDLIAIAEAVGEEPPEDVDEFALRFTIDEFTDDVEAPSDFTEIDVQQLLQTFLGGALGGGTGMGGTPPIPGGDREVIVPELGLACSDLQTLSPQEIEQFLSASGVPGALKKVRQGCPELF